MCWCGDITYVPTGEGWLYVASVIDLGSRRLIGYAMADHMRTQLVADALKMAAGTRGGRTDGIIFHGDRGAQGGFNRSSQHLEMEVIDGSSTGVGRQGASSGDAVARETDAGASGGARVLASDRSGQEH